VVDADRTVPVRSFGMGEAKEELRYTQLEGDFRIDFEPLGLETYKVALGVR